MTPTTRFGRNPLPKPEPPPRGLLAFLRRLRGLGKGGALGRFRFLRFATKTHRLMDQWIGVDDDDLRKTLDALRIQARYGKGGSPSFYMEALAAVGAAAEKTLGLKPYPEQLAGASALSNGFLAEMATGEGKTLTVALAAVQAGWQGRPCHVITANDYLAQRDCEWLTPLYAYCGVSVAYVTGESNPDERRTSYAADVTYLTSKELLADFLRDRLRQGRVHQPSLLAARILLEGNPGTTESTAGVVTRGIYSAFVDEADAVLVDEAVTPLIISQKYKDEAFAECSRIAGIIALELKPGKHYDPDFRRQEVKLTPKGIDELSKRSQEMPTIWRSFHRATEIVRQALTAREFFLRDRDYVVEEGKIVLVDRSTGRPKPQSTWRQGLHQAIEIKEGLPPSDATETLASMSFQNFFRLFRKLSGTTGTTKRAGGEFLKTYDLPVIRIPTHEPCIRRRFPDRFFSTDEEKYIAATREVKRLRVVGRPVLVGVDSVRTSELLAKHFTDAGIPFDLLNATRLKEEAEIISQAGRAAKVTIATNVAGRGTDIVLEDGVADLGGLHVLAIERMDTGRVDDQLRGRAGRQGDPGSTQCFVSLEHDLLRRFFPKILLNAFSTALSSKSPGANLLIYALIIYAQRRNERLGRQRRQSLMLRDKWLAESLSFGSG